MVTDVLQHGMNVLYDASYAVTKGACKGMSTFACIEHWKDMAIGALHMSLLCADAMVIQDAQLYYAALSDLIVPESQAVMCLKNSQRLHAQEQIKKALHAVCTTREALEKMSWQECIENSSEIATTMILDALVLHTVAQCTQTASNAFMKELAKVTESCQLFSKEYAVEVAGFGKLIVEDGPQVATQSAGLIKKDLVHFADNQSVIPQIRQQVCPARWTEEIAHKIRNIGDDILDVMEKAGGHTLERHVGKRYDYLKKRASKMKRTSVTTFTDKQTATNAVQENLKTNIKEISLWLAKEPEMELVCEVTHSYSVGMGILKAKNNPYYDLNSSRMILRKNDKSDFGFIILTAFPI